MLLKSVFILTYFLCQKVSTWKAAVHGNIQISLLQGIYSPCLAQCNSPENVTSGIAIVAPLSYFLFILVPQKNKQRF